MMLVECLPCDRMPVSFVLRLLTGTQSLVTTAAQPCSCSSHLNIESYRHRLSDWVRELEIPAILTLTPTRPPFFGDLWAFWHLPCADAMGNEKDAKAPKRKAGSRLMSLEFLTGCGMEILE